MDKSVQAEDRLPRIVPLPCRIKALQGEWALDGGIVRLFQEPGSGVLLALDDRGQQVNPLRVISRGKKLGREKAKEVPSAF